MTLARLIAENSGMFYPQEWFNGEAFLEREPRPWLGWPDRVAPFIVPELGGALEYTAADLAALYLEDPTRPLWRRYLWTADKDHLGQRVYVGDNGRGFEIHRHLHLTERWGVPV
jgi:hypothetical protein